MRTPRQIDNQADILADPAAHWPQRPRWICDADGQAWPCEPLRTHLLATMSVQEIGLEMGARYNFAIHELDVPPAQVHRQLLGWIRTEF